ncbi:MAG: hypothetical protein R3F46_06465 [bacterium]
MAAGQFACQSGLLRLLDGNIEILNGKYLFAVILQPVCQPAEAAHPELPVLQNQGSHPELPGLILIERATPPLAPIPQSAGKHLVNFAKQVSITEPLPVLWKIASVDRTDSGQPGIGPDRAEVPEACQAKPGQQHHKQQNAPHSVHA